MEFPIIQKSATELLDFPYHSVALSNSNYTTLKLSLTF